MIYFPTQNLFIEGPDCSGKTSLVSKIHKITNYKWHIHDRSQISRSIFANLYNRDIHDLKNVVHNELSNLNNRFIFLLPEFKIIKERYSERGDEIHDSLESIQKVYEAFKKSEKIFKNFPNVMIYKEPEVLKNADMISTSIHLSENCMLREIAEYVYNFTNACSNKESYPLSFTIYDDCKFEESNSNIMKYHREAEYYDTIYKKLHSKISRELSGKNEYNRKESIDSRRFVYSDDSCISFIQISIRDNIMDFNSVLRSSNVEKTFEYDLNFLYYLASTCYKRLGLECDYVRMRFNLNSAHII